jgi:hypothetical protein
MKRRMYSSYSNIFQFSSPPLASTDPPAVAVPPVMNLQTTPTRSPRILLVHQSRKGKPPKQREAAPTPLARSLPSRTPHHARPPPQLSSPSLRRRRRRHRHRLGTQPAGGDAPTSLLHSTRGQIQTPAQVRTAPQIFSRFWYGSRVSGCARHPLGVPPRL